MMIDENLVYNYISSKSRMAASSNSFAALDGLDMDTEEQALQSATDPYLKEKHAAALARGEKPLRDPIVWIDLEMTGLDLANDTIMEIAVIVTDGKLNTAIEVCVIGQYAHFSTLQLQMNAYCRIRASRTERLFFLSINL
jgi:oligoribonuclease